MTLEEYDALFAAQKGKCAVCRRPEFQRHPKTKKVQALSVDHDHGTKVVRGLLCSCCNRALGYLGDDPLRIRALAEYVER